jgi:flagellar M-ring protein FliF
MKKILASLSLRQRITIAIVAFAAAGGLYSLVHWKREADFRPLVTGLAPEDEAGVVQKLKESGVEYRLPEGGGSVLVPSQRLAEMRLAMAAAGLPKTGRIGFELFDKTNLGATEFTEHVNYRRALEGELERSIMGLAEVEQARVHLTFPKDSVYLDAQQPAKASVLVRLKPGAHLGQQNVLAINHLVASAVEGLSPGGVSVLDMNGNLLGKPKPAGGLDSPEPSEAGLEYRHQIETDLLAKINSSLEPLLGAEKFRAGVSVDCDFTGGEQSEETFDPARSVMLSSQRSEDSSGGTTSSGIPGTPSSLPRPAARPAPGANRTSRVSENITYQSSRTVKKMRLPAGNIRRISVAVLVDQTLSWQRDRNGYRRMLEPPSPDKLKVVHDLVAGVTGFNAERGDQLVVETQPFETTLTLEPPPMPAPPSGPATKAPGKPINLDRKTLIIAGSAAVALVILFVSGLVILRKKWRRSAKAVLTGPAELAAAGGAGPNPALEARHAEEEALQQEAATKALNSLKLAPVITKTAEIMAQHLREKISQEPELSAHVLRTWIREGEAQS